MRVRPRPDRVASRRRVVARTLPRFVGHGFPEAAQMAEAHGFRPGKNPYDLWGRVD